MKKIFTVLPLFLLFSLSAEKIQLSNDGSTTGYELLSNNTSNFEIQFRLKDLSFDEVTTERGDFIELKFQNSKNTNVVGSPKLPVFRELIEFPYSSNPQVNIVSFKETEILLNDYGINNKIFPTQPSYSKSTPLSEIKFIYKPEYYSLDGYSKGEIAKVTKSGTMRGAGVGVLEINPVSYNPVKNSLKIITDIKLNITYSDLKVNSEQIKAEQYSPYFDNQFSKLINYTPPTSKTDLTKYPITYLIVANEVLYGNAKLQEFIDWKTEKGFKIITHFFASSASISDVDSWVEDQYLTLSPKPTFLLIIGDQSGTYVIPTEHNPPLGSLGDVSVSDLLYSVIGTTSSENRIPSIYVGRFSINNLTELDAQIDKTIWYEKTQFTSGADLTYLSRVMGVAGVDGGNAAIYANPQIRYGMSYYFNDSYKLPLDGSNVNITGIPYYYPATASSTVDPEIVNHVSTGVAFYNYTAHGYNGGFADPSFSVSDVDNLTNLGKYPLVVGNCCLTGSFGDTECFAEAWLNAPDKGGIGFVGASMESLWNEDLVMGIGELVIGDITPSLSQDKQGMYDGIMMMDYPTQGGVRFAGLMAVEEYNSAYTDSYWSSYHLFGDPSLMVYMGIPGDNSVSHETALIQGDNFFTVQAKKGSYVSLTDDNGFLHGAALADETGSALIPIEPFISGNAHIVVSCQFKKPYFTSIPVVAPEGAYLKVNDYTLSTTDFGTFGTIDLELKNIGISTSEGISVTASSSSEYLTLSDFQENYANIAADDSLRKDAALAFNISQDVPDQKDIKIDLTIVDTSKSVYHSYIIFKANSPVLKYSFTNEGDVIYPGDTKDITLTVSNTGTADISEVTASLSESTGASVTISGQQVIPAINKGGSADLVFNIGFSTEIQNGSVLKFRLSLNTVNGYENYYFFDINVGMTENFETGDFSVNPWYFEGDAEWAIDNTVFYAGSYSSKSGYITDSQQTSMKIDFVYEHDGSISFNKKASSELNWDKLIFYIDGVEQENWSGDSDWSYHTYPVSEGIHTMKWTYSKDGSLLTGLDCAWVDNILAAGGIAGIEEQVLIPEKPMLYQNYPNPFNPSTMIKFYVPNDQNIKLNIYNSNGQFVRNLVDGNMIKGFHTVYFNAQDMISGIYFYRLETNGNKLTQKMLLIK